MRALLCVGAVKMTYIHEDSLDSDCMDSHHLDGKSHNKQSFVEKCDTAFVVESKHLPVHSLVIDIAVLSDCIASEVSEQTASRKWVICTLNDSLQAAASSGGYS